MVKRNNCGVIQDDKHVKQGSICAGLNIFVRLKLFVLKYMGTIENNRLYIESKNVFSLMHHGQVIHLRQMTLNGL